MATEQFYLVSFWLTASLPGFSSHPAKGAFFPVGISVIWAFHSSQLSSTLKEFTRGRPISFGQFTAVIGKN
jgi:hypothetical protein